MPNVQTLDNLAVHSTNPLIPHSDEDRRHRVRTLDHRRRKRRRRRSRRCQTRHRRLPYERRRRRKRRVMTRAEDFERERLCGGTVVVVRTVHVLGALVEDLCMFTFLAVGDDVPYTVSVLNILQSLTSTYGTRRWRRRSCHGGIQNAGDSSRQPGWAERPLRMSHREVGVVWRRIQPHCRLGP